MRRNAGLRLGWLVVGVVLFACAHPTQAQTPYTVDANTVNLWSFDDSSTVTRAGSAGTAGANAPVTSVPITATRGFDFGQQHERTPGYLGYPSYAGFGYAGKIGYNTPDDVTRSFTYVHPGSNQGANGIAGVQRIYGSMNGAFTIEGLFNFDQLDGSAANQYIMGTSYWAVGTRVYLRDLNTSNPQVYLNVDGGGRVGDWAGTPGASAFNAVENFGLGFQPQTNTWYHIALTYQPTTSANNVNFYWTPMTSATTTANLVRAMASQTPGGDHGSEWDQGWGPNIEYGNEFGIGRRSGEPFSGLVDEVRFSNVARGPNDFVFAVPEPSTFALGGGLAACGLVAAGIRRRRR